MDNRTVKTIAEAAAVSVLEALGLTSGEISYSRARAVYGNWFTQAAASGRLNPCRVGAGKTATKWYKVSEILAVRAEDERRAALQLEQ